MSATGRGALRHPDDYYATPAWGTQAILPHLGKPRSILEPAAGEGAIVRECRQRWPRARISGIEVDPDRAAVSGASLGDFLAPGSASAGWDLIITNPPFKLAQPFIVRALRLARTSCFLLRLNFLGSQKRVQFWRAHPADVYVLPKRPSFTGKGRDATEYAWFVWGPGRGNRWEILDVPSATRARQLTLTAEAP